MKYNENIDASGHLEIYKIYADGTEEQVFNDHNVITSGMGVGLGFQLGVSGDSKLDSYGVSETSLASALGQVNGTSDYATDAESVLPLSVHELMDYNSNLKVDSDGTGDAWIYGIISDNSIKRVDLNSVTYILYVDRYSCNSHTLNEIGLFMKNPLGLTPLDRSPLVAYRPFNNIAKTNDFALIFKWTLNF